MDLNRFLASLLIPILAIGGALPHSHGGHVALAGEHHDGRPHVHLGVSTLPGHSHHDEHSHHGSDDDCPYQARQAVCKEPAENTGMAIHGEEPATPHDHDADAIYLTGTSVFTCVSPGIESLPQTSVGVYCAELGQMAARVVCSQSGESLPALSTPPLFVLHAALRL
jgi:hypothetical protein